MSNVNHAPGKVIGDLQAEKGRRRWMVIRLKDKDDPDSLLGKQMNLLEKQGEERKNYYSLVSNLHLQGLRPPTKETLSTSVLSRALLHLNNCVCQNKKRDCAWQDLGRFDRTGVRVSSMGKQGHSRQLLDPRQARGKRGKARQMLNLPAGAGHASKARIPSSPPSYH